MTHLQINSPSWAVISMWNEKHLAHKDHGAHIFTHTSWASNHQWEVRLNVCVCMTAEWVQVLANGGGGNLTKYNFSLDVRFHSKGPFFLNDSAFLLRALGNIVKVKLPPPLMYTVEHR